MRAMTDPAASPPDDRRTAADLPPGRPFLTARWVHLAMLSYEVDPAVLAARVPAGTTLDLWEGRALVSVVGFRFLDTRVLGLPVPLHRHFEEVNLRFYVRREAPDGVRREAPDGVRRGVVFVKEIVPKPMIAWTARLLYGEPYVALPMRHTDEVSAEAGGRASYGWRRDGRWERMAIEVAGAPVLPPDGSEAAFVAEHYWGYTPREDGSTLEYRVVHPPWRVWRATGSELDADIAALYGPPFAEAMAGPPTSAFLAEGSGVAVYGGRTQRIGEADTRI
jgi:uncharacterized protein YqjF (DUF2071 family)